MTPLEKYTTRALKIFHGATREEVYGWNAGPVNIDIDPSRVWDWRDIQFLRGIP